jgi:hypothetical protein
LLKIDDCGNEMWSKQYAGSEARFVQQTSDNGYIVVGEKEEDIWLLKMDSNGDTVWTRRYGGETPDYGYCVRETPDSGYVVVGLKDTKTLYPPKGIVWLIKTDSNGDSLWTRAYGEQDGESVAYSLCLTDDGGYAISGATKTADSRELWLIKTDSLGDSLWARSYCSTLYGGYCVQQTFDGGYIVVGDAHDPTQDVLLLKVDALGDTQWTKTYGTEGHDIGYWVEPISDGSYVICGMKDGGPFEEDIWLLKTDSVGDTLWTKVFGGEYRDYGHSVCLTPDYGYLIAGVKDYGSFDNDIDSDMWLIRTDSLGDSSYAVVNEDPFVEEANWELVSSIGRQIILRGFNNEVQHLGKREGFRYPKDVCTRNTII